MASLETMDLNSGQQSWSSLAELRVRTRPLHDQLDKGSLLSRLAQPDCSKADYVQAAQALRAVYQQVDECLGQAASLCPPDLPRYEPRAPWLEADLVRLQGKLGVPCLQSLCPPADVSAYLGMRYVVEGAVLGARLIHRALAESPLAEELPIAECFWMRVQSFPITWPSLVRRLGQQTDASSTEATIAGASAVFQLFIQHLCTGRH